MAGSLLTVTEFSDQKIVLDWLSDDTNGTLTANVVSTYKTALATEATAYLVIPDEVKGFITGVEVSPGRNGDLSTSLPTDLYDITITDAYGVGLISGELADLSNSAAVKYMSNEPISVESEITLNVTNAGNGKEGRVIIYLK